MSLVWLYLPFDKRKFSSYIVIKSEYFIVNRRSIHIWTLIEANAWGVGHASLYIVTLSGHVVFTFYLCFRLFLTIDKLLLFNKPHFFRQSHFANLMFGNVKSFKGGSSLSSWLSLGWVCCTRWTPYKRKVGFYIWTKQPHRRHNWNHLSLGWLITRMHHIVRAGVSVLAPSSHHPLFVLASLRRIRMCRDPDDQFTFHYQIQHWAPGGLQWQHHSLAASSQSADF